MFNPQDQLWSSHVSVNQAKLTRAIAHVKATTPDDVTEETVKAEYIKLGGFVPSKPTNESGETAEGSITVKKGKKADKE